jgi:hypothetical protein
MKYLIVALVLLAGCSDGKKVYSCTAYLYDGSEKRICVKAKSLENAESFTELTFMIEAKSVKCEDNQ